MSNHENLTGTTATDQHGRACEVLQDTGDVNVRIRLMGTNFGGWVPRMTLTLTGKAWPDLDTPAPAALRAGGSDPSAPCPTT